MNRRPVITSTRDELHALAALLGHPPECRASFAARLGVDLAQSYHVAELVRELHGVHHNAMWHTPALGEALLALRLICSNARGWYDATPAGREEIAAALRAGTLTCEYNCEAR